MPVLTGFLYRYYVLFIPDDFFFQSLHDPLFQPRDIRLGDSQQICNLLLGLFPAIRHVNAKAEPYNGLLPFCQLPDSFSEKFSLHFIFNIFVNYILIGSKDI